VKTGPALLALALVWPASVVAQGLGDTAAREKARLKNAEASAPTVFTNDDLTERSEDPVDSENETTTPALDAEAPTTPPPSEPADPLREELDREREERALQEREWRARFAEARALGREAEARCWREVIRTEFHNGIPVQMKVQEFVETEEYRQAKADLENLGEEFRRTGHPPGWARE
jgi:hypothetical protein